MSGLCPPGKHSWPELVGMNGFDAAVVIEAENCNVKPIVLYYKDPVTQDYRCNRVRVFVKDDGIVVYTPVVG